MMREKSGSERKGEDMRRLEDRVDSLKREVERVKGEMEEKKAHSKTSIEEESGSKGRLEKANYTQLKFREEDKLKELLARVDYLEKMGSKNSIEDRSDGKLPMIRRAKGREASGHEKSGVRKDMAEVKNELQGWLNNYLANMKSKDNF